MYDTRFFRNLTSSPFASLRFPQPRLRILDAERAELRPVGVLSAATIKGAQRSREKRNEAGGRAGGPGSALPVLYDPGTAISRCIAHRGDVTPNVASRYLRGAYFSLCEH